MKYECDWPRCVALDNEKSKTSIQVLLDKLNSVVKELKETR